MKTVLGHTWQCACCSCCKPCLTSHNEPVYCAALPFHADQGATDIISLLSVGKSKAGGASRWVSAIAIHNELLRRGRKVNVNHVS